MPGETRNNNKKQRKRNRPRSKRVSGGPKQWHCPQTKVTFRNIKLESADEVLDMISTMITKTNNQQKSALPIHLDQESVGKIVKEQELIKTAQQEAKACSTSEEADDATTQEEGDGDQRGESANDVAMDTSPVPPPPDTTLAEKTMADVVIGEAAKDELPTGPVISARVLYLVIAKKSRRRGEKPGCAYLVLTAPPPPPPTAPVVQQPETTQIEGQVVTDGDAASTITSVDDETKKTPPTATPQYSPAERNRLMALSRLQLLQAVEALSAHSGDDCQVEQSVSVKTWRPSRGDKRDGTIETTVHYKQFITKQAKEIEERQSRPKPAVGGGAFVIKTGTESATDDQPLAAIVLHLRSKRRQEKQKKKVKKKPSTASNSKGGSNKSQSSRNSTSKGGRSRNKGRKDSSKSDGVASAKKS